MEPKKTPGQRFSEALAYTIIAAGCFALFSLIVWVTVVAWRGIIGA